MRRWLWVVVFGLLFFLFGVAAATVSRWGPPLWKALNTQADPIQSLAGIITVVLTAAALVATLASIARAKRPPREEARGQSQPRPSEPQTAEASGPDAVAVGGNVIIHAHDVQLGGSRQTTMAKPEAPQRPERPRGDTVPLPPDPYFAHPYPMPAHWTGRETEMDSLDAWLSSDGPPMCSLIAMGGTGKLNGNAMTPIDGKVSLQVLVDRPMIEICGNNGAVYITTDGGKRSAVASVTAFANGGPAKLTALEVHELKSIWKK